MKTKRSLTAIFSFFVLLALVITAWVSVRLLPLKSFTAQAASMDPYSYEIQAFQVDMDVSANRTIAVTERITVLHTGYESHGIIRDLPLSNGVKYKNLTATSTDDDFYYYSQDDDSDFLSVYLKGDSVITNQTRTYTLNYTMSVPALAEEGYLPLDVIGYGWQTTIENVSVTVTVPDGLENLEVYSGFYGTKQNKYAQCSRTGNVILITAQALPCGAYGDAAGITLDLQFSQGVLSTTADVAFIWAIGIVGLLIAAAILVRVFFCRQPVLTATVNFTAPNEMDPLHMGKLIDNSVDGEDIGALVFWFADQGYLTIDLTIEDDPLLQKTDKPFPADAPRHQTLLYEGLFDGKNQVYVSELKDKFYRTAAKVQTAVPSVEQGMYQKKTIAMLVLFGVFSILLCGCCALFLSHSVMYDYWYYMIFITTAVSFFVCAFGVTLAIQRAYKWSKGVLFLCRVLPFVIGILGSGLLFLVPSAAFGPWAGVVFTIGAAVVGLIVGGMLCRTQEYTDTLGQIVGFKNFILYTEKDKVKFMLQDNPMMFYRILPYAQVLGVTDEWTDKFQGISSTPPSYLRYDASDAVFDYFYWTSTFRLFNTAMSEAMFSHPSSNGGGGISGGFGGGFGGGGFGGGGGRGC